MFILYLNAKIEICTIDSLILEGTLCRILKVPVKRVKTSEVSRLRNRGHRQTMRTAIKKLRSTSDAESAKNMLNSVISIIDKNVKFGVIHRKKADRFKSRLTKMVQKLEQAN